MSIMVCQSCTRHVDTDFEPMEGEVCLWCVDDEPPVSTGASEGLTAPEAVLPQSVEGRPFTALELSHEN